MSPIILRPAMPEITLDDAVLEGIETFTNGCNFRLFIEGDDFYLTWGCYGVHPNLIQGKRRLLLDWFTSGAGSLTGIYLPKLLPISKETKVELLKRKPCDHCGAPWFKKVQE